MIQDLDRSTFNNIEQLSMDFVNSSLMPWLVRHEQTVNRDVLLPNERKKYVVRFDADSLQRGDMEARANYYASGIANRWLSPNEARKKEFLNPREGGDVYENPNTTSGTMKPGEPIKKKGSDSKSEGQ
jgi:HK97 family phage portal protein